MRTGRVNGASNLARARRLLARNGWIEAVADGYILRAGPDRRGRVVLAFDEAVFRGLVERPGLRRRPAGGWIARRERDEPPTPAPGCPGRIEGARAVMEPDGRLVARRANLAQTAVDWLARRLDANGRPWLEPAETAAAARLARDAEAALAGDSLTMRWDALPAIGAGGGAAHAARAPGEGRMAAAARVEAALAACGPARAMVEAVCVRASALQAAEQALGLRRRSGKLLLRQGLRALARHYRLA